MKIIDNSKKLLSAVDAKTHRRLNMAGQIVEDMVPSFCPVKTGATRDSRTHVVERKSVKIGVITPYAPLIEAGTSKMIPRPFMRQSLSAAMPVIRKLFKS